MDWKVTEKVCSFLKALLERTIYTLKGNRKGKKPKPFVRNNQKI